MRVEGEGCTAQVQEVAWRQVVRFWLRRVARRLHYRKEEGDDGSCGGGARYSSQRAGSCASGSEGVCVQCPIWLQ